MITISANQIKINVPSQVFLVGPKQRYELKINPVIVYQLPPTSVQVELTGMKNFLTVILL